ncbi:hypothetical protein [Saccharopolyspora phatthalungensis]|uniref:PPE family domain-containing protein n=1 Tax=Saccharopolyspora phatthalungensis TaxID=664693 RepID=A0A840QHG7_9PSEU|nr:hypothetical protein [Saccharopolyspora phatthalungensis]MBB5159617.1 hypothetical protein [Saccharopolyspora phatthalungensis]
MGAFDWLFGKQEIPGQAQMAFDHPKVYGEVESGPGVTAASQAAANWRDRVSAAFADADAALDRVLKDSEILMQGAAGDQSRDAVTPLSQATREAIEVAAQAGAAAQQQAQGSADFKNAFPAPYQVPPDNIGWGDYVNPISYGVKSGIRAAHEEQHDQVEAQARQQYESYTQATNDRVHGIQQFAPPPTFTGDVTAAQTAPVNKVDPSTGYTSTSDTNAGQPSTARTSYNPTPSASTPPGGQSSADRAAQVPAESGSAWATPPAAGPTPMPNLGVPAPGPGGGGFIGGAVIPPGSTGGGTPAPGTGGRVGGGTGTGRGVGPGTGVRGGTGNLGGGRAGVGGSAPGGTAGASGTAARGGAGGAAGAAGAAGRGQRSDEDKEHTNKYANPTDEAWKELGLPKVAPPVFGDWTAQAQEGKPPRPPEEQ